MTIFDPGPDPEDTSAIDESLERTEDLTELWQDVLMSRLQVVVDNIAATRGEPKVVWRNWLKVHESSLLNYLQPVSDVLLGGRNLTSDPEGVTYLEPMQHEVLYKNALSWLEARGGEAFQPSTTSTGAGGSRRTGGGVAAPPPDLDAMARQVNELWRSYLLEENPNAKAIAKAFATAQKSNPRLSFENFVIGRIENTGRYQSIYRNKPTSMSPLQYLQPYMQTAMQYVRPQDAASIAIGGAQFGADPAAYRARLSRDNAVRTSAPYIQGLEKMLSSVSGVLRG